MRNLRITPNQTEHRYTYNSSDNREECIRIWGSEYHHLVNVLRVKIGQKIEIKLPNCPSIKQAEIISIQSDFLEVRLIASIEENGTLLGLIIGNVRSVIADDIVMQCVSAGVTSICFFQADRSQGQHKITPVSTKLSRLIRLANSSMKQSGLNSTCQISCTETLYDAINDSTPHYTEQHTQRLLLTPQQKDNVLNPPDIISHLQEEKLESQERAINSLLLIGPEGGFSNNEIKLAVDKGFKPVSLGNRTLRTETAALAVSVIIPMLRSRLNE